MTRARLDFAYGLLENLPTIVFVGLWNTGAGLQVAGWSASLAAILVLSTFARLGRGPDTILLGINVNFAMTAPIIASLFLVGQMELARWVLGHVEAGAIATVFLTGICLTICSARGFVGSDAGSASERRRYSLLLLTLSAATVGWSAAHTGNHWMSIVLPLVVLFAARRFLVAQLTDGEQRDAGPSLAVVATPVSE